MAERLQALSPERLLISAFDHSLVAMSVVDPDGARLRVNDALCQLLGYRREELLGGTIGDVTHPDDVAEDAEWRRAATAGESERLDRDKRYLARDGSTIWAHARAEAIRDSDGKPAAFVTLIEDITARRAIEKALRASEQRLSSILHHISDAVYVLDLDHRYLLANSAFEQRFGLSPGWIVGRRDDEVLMEDAVVVDRELHDRVAATGQLLAQEQVVVKAGGDRTYSTARFPLYDEAGDVYGVCAILRDITDLKGYEEDLRGRVEWTDRIHTAIAQDRLLLHAQPILSLASGKVEQAELLVRMTERSDSLTLIPPSEFLPAAERFDLAGVIDRWVVAQGVELAKEHRVELNLSGQTISDPALVAEIEGLVAASGAPPDNIVFEITETAVVRNTSSARRFAERLGELGCAFALDDFGVGFGSFKYLKHLPVDYLKIDIEFVRDLVWDEADRQVVSALVGVANNFGIETIAEGVEDEATLKILDEMGVDYAQGFCVGRPVPVPDLWPTV